MKSILFLFSLVAGLFLVTPVSAIAANEEESANLPSFSTDQITGPITLRSAIYVNSDVVLLGDIFLNTGTLAEKSVAYAPEPGDIETYNAMWLDRVARYYGLEWRPKAVQFLIESGGFPKAFFCDSL